MNDAAVAQPDGAPTGAFGETGDDRDFLDELVQLGPPESGTLGHALGPPASNEAGILLAELGVDDEDARAVVATLPDQASPWWWCVERTARLIAREMGTPFPRGRSRPAVEGPGLAIERRCFLAHVFLALVGETRAWHRGIGIPEAVSSATLADLRRHMAIHRRRFGAVGVDGGWWVTMALRGAIFELGRLQFERQRLGSGYSARWEPEWPPPGGRLTPREGDWCLGVHIPEDGRLDPVSVETSFALAADFFRRHFAGEFPVDTPLFATCTSWMLDPQLGSYLAEDSRIMRFQRRFALLPDGPVDDRGIVRFVFRRRLDDIDALPQRTTLERAVVGHLRAGRHWVATTGWCELSAP